MLIAKLLTIFHYVRADQDILEILSAIVIYNLLNVSFL